MPDFHTNRDKLINTIAIKICQNKKSQPGPYINILDGTEDINAIGKIENKSIAELLGGLKTESIPAYASLFLYNDAEATARVSLKAKNEGYQIVKLHENTISPIQSSRIAIGETSLMVDVNCVWSEEHTYDILDSLKDANLYWLEEPIWPPENFSGLSKLRNKGLTIATGENACTAYQFEEIISKLSFVMYNGVQFTSNASTL